MFYRTYDIDYDIYNSANYSYEYDYEEEGFFVPFIKKPIEEEGYDFFLSEEIEEIEIEDTEIPF